MSRLVLFMILMFVFTSAVFADIDFNENIYSHMEKPVTKISDLGVTVATNEKDFRLVLKRNEAERKAAVKAKWFPKPEPKRVSKAGAKKKNPRTRRLASSGKRVKS